GGFVVDMGPGNAAGISFRNTETLNQFHHTGGGVPFDIQSGNFLFGMPIRNNNTIINGQVFSGTGTVLHENLNRHAFGTLFGTSANSIPAGSSVGIGGQYDTIDL